MIQHLPVEEIHCQLDESERICECCGDPLHHMGQKISREEVQFIPASLRKKVYIEHSYECQRCKKVDQPVIKRASSPKAPLQRSFAGPSVLAWLFHQKFELSLPLYRQEKEWALYGIELSRKTLANWIIRCSQDWLEPLYDRLKHQLNQEEAVHADETPYQVLHRSDGKPATSEARMWLFQTIEGSAKPVILYHASLNRARTNIEEVLAHYKGYLHCDGYSAYQNIPKLSVVACWAHVRRKFFEASDSKGQAAIGVMFCDKLFTLEKKFSSLPPEDRHAQRQLHSLPIVMEFWEWLETLPVLAKSKLGIAVAYAIRLKSELMRFLEDGRLALSNNLAERSIRPLTIGRKNFLFSTSFNGAKANAVAYSIIETAKANGLNAFKYLTKLFEDLPNLDVVRSPECLETYLPWSAESQQLCQ